MLYVVSQYIFAKPHGFHYISESSHVIRKMVWLIESYKGTDWPEVSGFFLIWSNRDF